MHRADTFQQEAIASTDRGIRIVAPAGSGKTQTIAQRVAHAIEQGTDRDRILVLTFDNNAKKSLESFMKSAVPRKQMPRIRTFNQHGLDILKRWFPDANAPLMTQAHEAELKRHFRPHEMDLPVLEWDGIRRPLLDVFEALKDQGYAPGSKGDVDRQTHWLRTEYLRLPQEGESVSIDDFYRLDDRAPRTDSYAPQLATIVELYAEHDRLCREMGIMTFADQKSRAFHRIWRAPAARAELRAMYDEVIVDECQDINRLDALLIYITAEGARSLVLTGDDDQTLYEFRNAYSLYLREPDRFFPDRDFRTIHLNINYRSPAAILEPASRLIAHNVERIEKSPVSGVQAAGQVSVLPASSQAEHAAHLVRLVRQHADARDATWGDIAVLCHSDSVARETRDILQRAGIPIQSSRGNQNTSSSDDGVEILTLLKSKGREWPMVILPHFDDRSVPDDFSVRKGELESIRRRVYVAMTRATQHLAITYVRAGDQDVQHRTSDGDVVSTNGASRFLFEAGLVEDASVLPAAAENDAAPEIAVDEPVETTAPPVEAEEPSPAVEPEPDPVPAATPAEQPTPVTPEQPAEAPPPPPLPRQKRGKLQPWDLRQGEIRHLEKGRALWAKQDYDYAVTCSWKAIEAVMRRLFGNTSRGDRLAIVDLLRIAETRHAMAPEWADRAHAWRVLRNETSHSTHDIFRDQPGNLDTGFQLVDQAPDFLAHIADHVAPKQAPLETHDEFIERLTGLVAMIRQERALPTTGRPIRNLRFNPQREALEILIMQFMMILNDVRFFIPEHYRWDSSSLLTRFVVRELGWVPKGMGGRPTNRCHASSADEERQVLNRLALVLEREAGDVPSKRFLEQRVDDALKLHNGNFHAGVKINPREVG